jgi:hypothetical protein
MVIVVRLEEFRESGCGDSRIWAFLRCCTSRVLGRGWYANQSKLWARMCASPGSKGLDWYILAVPSTEWPDFEVIEVQTCRLRAVYASEHKSEHVLDH